VAFPKTASGNDLTVFSPSKISEKSMKEYGIQLIPNDKYKNVMNVLKQIKKKIFFFI
jgi:hypothetical protein